MVERERKEREIERDRERERREGMRDEGRLFRETGIRSWKLSVAVFISL